LFLLLKKGNVTCGCLGFQSKSKLSYKLVFYNLILGSIALISASSISFNGLLSSGLFLEIVLLVLSLFIVIGVPDALYAIRGYRKVAEKYYPKISSRNGVN
jgi:predicted ferric reductase